MALLHEMRTAEMPTADTNANPTDVFLLSLARQNLSAVLNALWKMEQYWAGVTPVVTILEKRSGMSRPDRRNVKQTFISLPDKGLLRRFTTSE